MRTVLLIAVGVLVVVMALANPSEEAHKQAVYNALGEAVSQQVDSQGPVGALVGKAATTVARRLDLPIFEYHNYVLFSTTSIQGRTASYGFLGNVIVQRQ
jgi:hypothetical protein